MINLSIILPVFNDSQALAQFLPLILNFTRGLEHHNEIIIIDDGSQDDTKTVLDDLMGKTPSNTTVKLFKFSRNFGKEAALSAGLSKAQGQLVALMDADGQHPISVLEEMVAIYRSNTVDMIAAIQATRTHEGFLLKHFKKSFYNFIQDTKRYEIKPNAGDFRLMNRKVVDALLTLPERQRFMKGLYAWVGFKTIYLPFQAEQRNTGQSKFNYANLFELATVGITSFSQKPLRWISRTGLLISLLAILYGFFIIFDTLFFGKSISGWPTLAVGIMFSSGVQLIFLGVIGEYIGRIYEEIKQRPLYIVSEAYEIKSEDE